MVETRRLIKPGDDFIAAFPGLNFRNLRRFSTAGEKVLLVDPTYIADVYNSIDEIACFVRERGLFLMDFGGDTAAPVWWKPPFLIMPISRRLEDLVAPSDTKVLMEEIGCDSGSFVFLPLSEDMPGSVRSRMQEVLGGTNAVALQLPAGLWTAYYEQFESPQANMVGLYRNIVLKHTRGRIGGPMTKLPQRAVAEVEKLPAADQDAIAARLLAEGDDERQWEGRLASTTDDQWDRLVAEVRRDVTEGGTLPTDDVFPPDESPR